MMKLNKLFTKTTLFLGGIFFLVGGIFPMQAYTQSIDNPFQGELPDQIPFLPAGSAGALSQNAQNRLNEFYRTKKNQESFGVGDAWEFKNLYNSLDSADQQIIRGEVLNYTNKTIDLDDNVVFNAIQVVRFLTSDQAPNNQISNEQSEKLSQQATNAGIFTGVTEVCWESGQCTLCDLLTVFITVANIILRVFAVLATVFFIYGAGYLMLSSGNEEWVSKGKGVMRATIVGSLIVLLAWQIMNFVIILFANQSIFIQNPEQSQVPLSPLGWYKVAEQCKQ